MLNELYHSLDPVAFSAGPITIYWYGLAYMVGALLAGFVMYRTQKRWNIGFTPDDVMTVVIAVVFGLLIGGRLGYVLFYSNGYYFTHPLEIFFGTNRRRNQRHEFPRRSCRRLAGRAHRLPLPATLSSHGGRCPPLWACRWRFAWGAARTS